MKALVIEHRGLAALLVAFLILGTVYSVATPLFEAGDELWHYPFVQHLATGHGLPIQDPARKELWEQEGGQPPLYYALSAAATFWIDTSDLPERLWRNPFARVGIPLAFGNKNLIVHTSAEDFPWHNTALAVHLIRFLSLLFCAGTLVLTYLLASEIAVAAKIRNPRAIALVAASLVAFNPMFLFIGASVNNDNLATLLASSGLLLAVQLVTRGPGTRRLVALGVIAGLGALTKVSVLALVPLALLVVAWLAYREKSLRNLIRGGILVGVPPLLIAGWWYLRNLLLYGDPLAFNVWLKISGGRPPVTLLGLLDEFQGMRISFWGNFGGVNLIAPGWVYSALDLMGALALLGLLIGLWRKTLPAVLWIPAAWLAALAVSLIRWTLLTFASQGRLIFPGISAVAVLLAFGLASLAGQVIRLRPRPADTALGRLVNLPGYGLSLFLLAFATAAPFFIIAPAYAFPTRLSGDAPVPNPVHITFDAGSTRPELVGYEIGRSVEPGGELPITLYWRSATPIDQDLYAYIHLYDAAGEPLGQWDALPGNGMYPTRLWQPNEIIVDRYRVPVSMQAQGPQVGRVEVGLTPLGSTVPLVARNPSGDEIVPTVARFKIPAAIATSTGQPLAFTFGEVLGLARIHLSGLRGARRFELGQDIRLFGGDVLQLELALRAARSPDRDYTVFVHLLDASGQTVAQIDRPPLGTAYPTSFWDAGEEVSDTFEIQIPVSLPAGDYRLELGLYEAPNGPRLPVSGDALDGVSAAGDHLLISPIRIGK